MKSISYSIENYGSILFDNLHFTFNFDLVLMIKQFHVFLLHILEHLIGLGIVSVLDGLFIV